MKPLMNSASPGALRDGDGAVPAVTRTGRSKVRTRAAAEYVGLGESTLEKDRLSGLLGIPYLKVGRAVLYDLDLLDTWLARHQRLNTSQPKAA